MLDQHLDTFGVPIHCCLHQRNLLVSVGCADWSAVVDQYLHNLHMPGFCCQTQRCTEVVVHTVYVHLINQQALDCALLAAAR